MQKSQERKTRQHGEKIRRKIARGTWKERGYGQRSVLRCSYISINMIDIDDNSKNKSIHQLINQM